MITVTKPFLPPKVEYDAYLNDIWSRNWLTNDGPLLQKLEGELVNYLGVEHCKVVANGTIALQIAIKALDLTGEIITTPFSYVATTTSIVWEGCTPVFVDISPDQLTIDADKIEAAITDKTSAILATHIFGGTCEVQKIKAIADKYNLKVIYDAAHGFGSKHGGVSAFDYGDISITSFHATKLYHTIEGGAVFTKDPVLNKRIDLLRNFGHTSATTFSGIGTNGKVSEMHAAMGLCNLKYVDRILNRRREQSQLYDELLQNIPLVRPAIHPDCTYNYAYYAVVLKDEETLLRSIEKLKAADIIARRYFYPSLSTLAYVDNDAHKTPVSDDVAKRIMCLPLYDQLKLEDIQLVCTVLSGALLEK